MIEKGAQLVAKILITCRMGNCNNVIKTILIKSGNNISESDDFILFTLVEPKSLIANILVDFTKIIVITIIARIAIMNCNVIGTFKISNTFPVSSTAIREQSSNIQRK